MCYNSNSQLLALLCPHCCTVSPGWDFWQHILHLQQALGRARSVQGANTLHPLELLFQHSFLVPAFPANTPAPEHGPWLHKEHVISYNRLYKPQGELSSERPLRDKHRKSRRGRAHWDAMLLIAFLSIRKGTRWSCRVVSTQP